MANLRAGLMGLGMMGRHHARVLASMDGVDLVAVADPAGDPYRAAPALQPLSSLEELIEANLDLCVVAVPTVHHESTATALAAAGVHTLVEKPLAPDAAAGARMAAAFEAAGLVGAVGHIERYNPALQSMRARLESGDLGDLYQVTTRRQGPFPPRIADVGVVMDLASHDIDLTAWVVGHPYTSVAAQTAHKSGRAHEDLVAFIGRLSDDTVASHLVNWLSPIKERIAIVTGERGCFVADTLTADLTFHANGGAEVGWDSISQFRGVTEGDVIRYSIPKPEPLRIELEAFRDAVLGLSMDVVRMHEGLATVRVAEAVLRSARDGASVEVETDLP